MAERDELLRGVYARGHRELADRSVSGFRPDVNLAASFERSARSDQRVLLGAGQLQRHGILSGLELQWQHAHVDEIAAMNPLE